MTTIAERAKLVRARQAAESELAAQRLAEEIRRKVDAVGVEADNFLSNCREVIAAEMTSDGDVTPIPIPYNVAVALNIDSGPEYLQGCAEWKWTELKEWGTKEGLRIYTSKHDSDWEAKCYVHADLIED